MVKFETKSCSILEGFLVNIWKDGVGTLLQSRRSRIQKYRPTERERGRNGNGGCQAFLPDWNIRSSLFLLLFHFANKLPTQKLLYVFYKNYGSSPRSFDNLIFIFLQIWVQTSLQKGQMKAVITNQGEPETRAQSLQRYTYGFSVCRSQKHKKILMTWLYFLCFQDLVHRMLVKLRLGCRELVPGVPPIFAIPWSLNQFN